MSTWQKSLGFVLLFLLFAVEAKAAKTEYFMYGIGESFTWQVAGAARKDQGFLYGVGAQGKWNPYSNLTLKAITEIKGNRFEEGQRVEFLMIKVTGDMGWKFDVTNSSSVEPFIGFGYRRWLRDVEAYRASPSYTQIWRSHFWRFGVDARHVFTDALKGYMTLGAIIPSASRMKEQRGGMTNRIDFDSEASAFVEVGLKYKMIKGVIYYEGIRFPAAETAYIRQPRTKADMYGIKLGVAF